MSDNSFKSEFYYFTLIAEELNISKAAEKAFISQQALSKYLAGLEQKCGAKLFYRKPTFSLTPAGMALFRRAKQIQHLTDTATEEISAIKNGQTGQIRFGIGKGRSFNIVPTVIDAYWKRYPNINLQIYTGATYEFREMILNEKLDLAFGVSPEPDPDLLITPLSNESMYLAVTDDMLRKYFPDEFPQCKTRFYNNVDLREFSHVPFVINRKTTGINDNFLQYLSNRSIHLNFAVTTDSNELNFLLCNSVCCFCLGLSENYYLPPYSCVWLI